MNRNLVLRVTAPAVAVGVLLLVCCLAGVRYINRLHRNLADVLTDNVTSLRSARDLEIRVRQLRFHTTLYLLDPSPARMEIIRADVSHFEEALVAARASAVTAEEEKSIARIEAAYDEYRAELRIETASRRPPGEVVNFVDAHPIGKVVDPCHTFAELNEQKMEQAADESQRLARQGSVAMIGLGVAGITGGLVMGYGVARALRQSIYRLSVRVLDMAQHLGRDVATFNVIADGDFQSLDRRMQHVVGQVEEVASRLQRQQRELLRAEQLAAVGQLAAGVAHEVRNPLAGVTMLVEAAIRPNKPRPLGAEDLQMMRRELRRVEQTVQGLLDYARLPAPKLEPCELREIVAEAVNVVRPRADDQKVAVRLGDPDMAVLILADRELIHTVLINLLLNALDAMPDGGELDVAWEPAADGKARLTVDDRGLGIRADIANKLFTPFATTKVSGTGLGLSISARIIEEHGGTIVAENRPGGVRG